MIHQVSSLNELETVLKEFKNNNYGYISYIIGEYGMVINYYKTYVFNFYQELKKRNIKTVGFIFKNTQSFIYNCCDEIIEYQDIEFDNTNNNISSYYDNDGWALQYIRGIINYEYEEILNRIDFENIFYTLSLDGSYHYNKKNGFNPIFYNNHINLYKIMNNECSIYIPLYYGITPYANNIITNDKVKKRNIAIWIRNTNKHPFRNTYLETYNTVFNYCIINNINCYVFLDLLPVELPESIYIKNCTERFKNRPNWDNFLNILSNCDFYIGSDSGSSEFVLLNIKINCLFDNYDNNYLIHLKEIKEKNKDDGYFCKKINFPLEFASIMDDFYK